MLADVAVAVEHIVSTAPRLTVLATSRERLAVAEEHVHLVAPLGLPSESEKGSAVELFLNRATALESGTLSETDLTDFVDLCRRLDGMPLALELAAARAPAFGIREFTEQVGAEIDLLAGGRRTVARHQTMRAVVDASYRLLTEGEALLFERLAVFPTASGSPTSVVSARTIGCPRPRWAASWHDWSSSRWCKPATAALAFSTRCGPTGHSTRTTRSASPTSVRHHSSAR